MCFSDEFQDNILHNLKDKYNISYADMFSNESSNRKYKLHETQIDNKKVV